ncbi:MAG TPA: DUF3037 domain-containing protein [Solirubrobacteraceae bacterium]
MPGASSRSPFSYLILRAVPSVERGERVNVGVVLFCRQRRFLGARVTVDEERLAALGDQGIDVRQLEDHLAALVRVAEGAPGAGPVAALEPSDRFGWLAAPSSTIVQPSEVHTGLCDDPEAMLEALHARLVG